MGKRFKDVQSTFTIEDGVKTYNINYCLSYIEYQGKIKYGRYFQLDAFDLEVLTKLIVYAIRDEVKAKEFAIDLNKGILLTGPEGCGKTAIMALLRPFFNSKASYKIKSCREITFAFLKNKAKAFQDYTQKENSTVRLAGYCFDDLGAEQNIKHYDHDNQNAIETLLLQRYEDSKNSTVVTHITSSLTPDAIKAHYGVAFYSKIEAMCTVVSFGDASRDKRGVELGVGS